MNNLVKHETQTPGMGFGMEINTLDELERLALWSCQSGFFKNARDVGQGCMIMAYGGELGIKPIASLQNIHVIEGKLAISGSMIAALIKSAPRYDYRPLEVSSTKSRILFIQDGVDQGVAEYTWEDGARAGLTKKFNWKNYPEDMIWWRAMARGARRFCPDVFLGCVYTPEELSDGEAMPDGEPSTPPPPVIVSTAPKPTEKKVEGKNGENKNGEGILPVLEGCATPDVVAITQEVEEPQRAKRKTTSVTSVILSFMSAVDSCINNEDLDDTMDNWEDSLRELPRGADHCNAYWRVALANMNDEKPSADDVDMANKLSQVKK